jgi:argininosuccinate lyase
MLVETLDALAGAVETARFQPDRMRAALEGGESLATDAAEWLVERGVPFREAHEAVGKAAAFATAGGRPLSGLSVAEWRRFHPRFDRGVIRCFDPERSVARRDLPGGPAPRRVEAELRRWERTLGRGR